MFVTKQRQEKAKQHAEEKEKKKQEKSTASVENKEKNHEEQETGEKAQDNGTSTESTVQTKATDSKASKVCLRNKINLGVELCFISFKDKGSWRFLQCFHADVVHLS